jgi:hypothetical protein
MRKVLSGSLNPFFGKHHTKETKQKISMTNKGRKASEETRKKMSLAHEGNKSNLGRKFTKEHRLNISNNSARYWLGKKIPKNVCDKISKTLLGKPCPWHRGNKSNFWKGGASSESKICKSSLEYRIFIRKVFKRDNYICRKCKRVGGKLNVHHLKNFSKYFKLRLLPINGVTLCLKCHRAFHRIYGIKNNTIDQIKEYLR